MPDDPPVYLLLVTDLAGPLEHPAVLTATARLDAALAAFWALHGSDERLIELEVWHDARRRGSIEPGPAGRLVYLPEGDVPQTTAIDGVAQLLDAHHTHHTGT